MDPTFADFRSDTLTTPTPEMRAAIAAAAVGDDVLGEDPTVNELERRGAAFLGMEAALFVPSGTMGNQIAIHVHCRPGDELICEERSHVFLYEGGSIARLSGTQVRTLPAANGFPDPEQVRAAIRSSDVHHPRTRLLVIENTHNMAGGTVLDGPGMRALADVARGAGARVHVDGARLVNAAVALGVAPAELTADIDTVSVCLSKGLGAPVGSLLAGSMEFVSAGRRVRKAFGGGMRQAGLLAAAGLLALDEGPAALAVDHARANRLHAAFGDLPGISPAPVQTNIVMVDLETSAADLVDALEPQGVRASAYGPRRVRFVTHCDLSEADVDRCIEAVTNWARERAGEGKT